MDKQHKDYTLEYIDSMRLEITKLREQLEAYKMEAEEGIEINAELKAELEQYKDLAEHNGRVCNERLDKIDELEHNINELNEQLDQLKADNKELKKIIKRLDVPKHEVIDMDIAFENEKLRTENEELKKRVKGEIHLGNRYKEDFAEQFKQSEKYKQTLTEIKEIAEPFCNACQEFEPEKRGRDCMYCNYGKILQKISEATND